MTSHKRSLEIENKQFYDPPYSSPQRLCKDSLDNDEEQPIFSDRGWKSIWQEVIGQASNNEQVSQPSSQDTFQEFVENTYPSSSAHDGVADIESWMTAELAQYPSTGGLDSLKQDRSPDVETQHTCDVCYGMVSISLLGFTLHFEHEMCIKRCC